MSRSGHYRQPGNALAGVGPWIRLMRAPMLVQQLAGLDFGPVLSVAFRGFGSKSGRECHRPDLPWQTWNEPLSRYDVTVTVGCDGGYLPDPAAFTAAAGQAAWGRSARSSAPTSPTRSSASSRSPPPDWYAAAAVARAVVSGALKRQVLSSSR
jgi:hypothetical protein